MGHKINGDEWRSQKHQQSRRSSRSPCLGPSISFFTTFSKSTKGSFKSIFSFCQSMVDFLLAGTSGGKFWLLCQYPSLCQQSPSQDLQHGLWKWTLFVTSPPPKAVKTAASLGRCQPFCSLRSKPRPHSLARLPNDQRHFAKCIHAIYLYGISTNPVCSPTGRSAIYTYLLLRGFFMGIGSFWMVQFCGICQATATTFMTSLVV